MHSAQKFNRIMFGFRQKSRFVGPWTDLFEKLSNGILVGARVDIWVWRGPGGPGGAPGGGGGGGSWGPKNRPTNSQC